MGTKVNHYVVYVTFYRGNRLPPFYIGYTSEAKVLKGYNGTVSSERYKAIWRRERKEHPELFLTVILQSFDSELEAKTREEFLHRKLAVVNNPLYTNMAVANGKFGGSGENSPSYGRVVSEKTRKRVIDSNHRRRGEKRGPLDEGRRRKLLNSNLGKKPWNKGNKYPLSVSISERDLARVITRKVSIRALAKELNHTYSCVYRALGRSVSC